MNQTEHSVFISYSSKNEAIADMIRKGLEEAGIPCWFAPRDIRSVSWADAIMNALKKVDVFVLVMTKDSLESREVEKEVARATDICEFILPFRVDNSEINDTMQYHLGPFQWMDATNPPLEQRVQELISRIRRLPGDDFDNSNLSRRKLISQTLHTKPLFLGRENEIAEIAELLQSDHVLFLQGMGGIGKSELAKGYAEKYADRYKATVFAGYRGSLMDTICGDDLSIENFTPWNAQTESREAFYQRKMDTLRAVTDEHTLVILDNYDVDSDPQFEDLTGMPFHLIITSRNDHSDYPTLPVGPIADKAKVFELFKKCYGRPIRPAEAQEVEKLLELVAWHTITVELLAKQMSASRASAAQMAEALKNATMSRRMKEKVSYGRDVRAASAADYIHGLFSMEDLSEEEKKILICMTAVPFTGIDTRLFGDILGLETFDSINDLIAHSWLTEDLDTGHLMMHPIISEVVREEFQPTARDCADYISGLDREIGSLWPFAKEERNEYWPLYDTLLTRLTEWQELPEDLYPAVVQAPSNAWICSRYETSIRMGHWLLDYTRAHFPEDSKKIGMAASLLGGDYYNSGDHIQAEPYYEIGLESQLAAITEESSETDWGNLARAYQQVARCARYAGNYEKSRELFEKSLQINEGRGVMMYYGAGLLETSELFLCMGDYDKALKYAEKSLQMITQRGYKPDEAISRKQVGRCLTALGRYREAEGYLTEALDLSLEYNGEKHRQTFTAREALADLRYAMGDHEEAARLYLELEMDMAKDFGEKNPSVLSFREKRERAEAKG